MEDFDCDVVKALLKYIYTSKVTNMPNLLEGLLAASHKVISHSFGIWIVSIWRIFLFIFFMQYQLKELKDICEKRLINGIDEENFFDLLCSANKHKADQLKQKTLEYISKYEWNNF